MSKRSELQFPIKQQMHNKVMRSKEPSGNIMSASHTTLQLKSSSSNNGGSVGRGLKCARPPELHGSWFCCYYTTGSFAADCFDWWFPRQSRVQTRGMGRALMIPPVALSFCFYDGCKYYPQTATLLDITAGLKKGSYRLRWDI